MTAETVDHLRGLFVAAGSMRNQDVILAALVFDSLRGRVHPLCDERVMMLLGVGSARLAKVMNMARRAKAAAIQPEQHGGTGVAPANKTDAATEEEIIKHFKEWIKFVPEEAGGKSYAKFISFDMNSVAALARSFNRERVKTEVRALVLPQCPAARPVLCFCPLLPPRLRCCCCCSPRLRCCFAVLLLLAPMPPPLLPPFLVASPASPAGSGPMVAARRWSP